MGNLPKSAAIEIQVITHDGAIQSAETPPALKALVQCVADSDGLRVAISRIETKVGPAMSALCEVESNLGGPALYVHAFYDRNAWTAAEVQDRVNMPIGAPQL